MKVNSQLERAQFENLTVLPTSATAGRVAFNTTDGKMYLDDAASWRAILRNDGKIIVGNDPLPANNVRFHRGGPGFIQVLLGNDVTAEGALSTTLAQMSLRHGNFTSGTLPANGNAGRLVWVSDTGFLNIDTGSAWNSIVDASSAQTIAGKTLVDPTISASTVFSQIVTPATPSSGTRKIYAKADGLYQLDSSGIETKVGSGSGSAGSTPLNALFPNPDAETNAPGFSTYADVVSAVPTTGLGGTPTLTFVRSTTTPLDGLYSWLLTKPASNIQGQGVNAAITVPTSYQGRVLQGSFSCKVLTGTYTDGDAQLYFYDATNNVVVSLMEGQSILNAIGSQDQLFRLQMPINCTSGRFLIHWTTTSATALTMQFDDFSLGKQLSPRGSVRTDYVPFTGNITGSGGGTLVVGTGGTQFFEFARDGQEMVARYTVQVGSSGYANISAGSAYVFPLPPGITLSQGGYDVIGYGDATNINTANPAARYIAKVFSTGFILDTSDSALANSGDVIVYNSVNKITVYIRAKVQGWSSGLTMSSSNSGRVVAANATIATSGTSIANSGLNKVIFNSPHVDTVGGYDSANSWYITKEPGLYRIYGQISYSGQTANASNDVRVYVDGAYVSLSNAPSIASLGVGISFQTIKQLSAGQKIEVYTYNSGNAVYLRGDDSAAEISVLNIERISSGSQQIAATEAVNCAYSSSASQSLSNAAWTTVTFATKDEDTHGAFDGTTWTSKAPGRYLVTYSSAIVATAVGGEAINRIYYNNVTEIRGQRGYIGATGVVGLAVTKVFSSVKVGDTITLGTYQTNGGVRTLEGSSGSTFFSITRLN